MRRKPIAEMPPDPAVVENSGRISKTFSFELITPMFGGDAKSWKLDEVNPVRAQSVKGQLRFWWRTMQTEQSPQKLLQMENTVWGGKSSGDVRIKSPVSIAVVEQNVEEKTYARMENRHAVSGDVIPKYVLFPITEPVKNDKHRVAFISKLRFSLICTFPSECEKDLLDTLTLWTLFGGVGARTRRGTGSLYCEKLLSGFSDMGSVADWVSARTGGAAVLPYPSLSGSTIWMKKVPGSADAAWRSLLNGYSEFRQQRTPNKPKPGRSYWPEPDAIRLITKKYQKHQPEHPDGIWFPRAAFGLPVLTRFNTGGKDENNGDPSGQFTLEPETGDRWPSPVILKSLKLSDDAVFTIMFVLGQKAPERLKLKGPGANRTLEASANPENSKDKIMVTKDPLDGRIIFGALADKLGLEAVQ